MRYLFAAGRGGHSSRGLAATWNRHAVLSRESENMERALTI